MPQIRRIRITAGSTTVVAELSTSETATLLWDALPFTGRVQTWGDEIYFSVPVQAEVDDDAVETVERGAVAYWPPGRALCLFWGPTPMSRGDEIRPASAVNVFGRIEGDPTVLDQVEPGTDMTVERQP